MPLLPAASEVDGFYARADYGEGADATAEMTPL